MNGYEFIWKEIKRKHILNYGTYIICIKYKHDYEDTYTIIKEVLDYTPTEIGWLNDWYEGQQDLTLVGIVEIDKLPISVFY